MTGGAARSVATGTRITRRDLLAGAALAGAVAVFPSASTHAQQQKPVPTFDAHVHVWDLTQFHLPWLDHNLPLLRRNYTVADYATAVKGLGVEAAAYIEVNVEPAQRAAEGAFAVRLCDQPQSVFKAGVIAGDPRDPGFGAYLDSFKRNACIKGVRFAFPREGGSDAAFIGGLRELGRRGMSFDLQLGPALLEDAVKATVACGETPFVLDHCGGASPRAFRAEFENDVAARRERELWRSGIAAMARRPNVTCKISGVADSALPGDATAADVAPVVNFCLDAFGPDRVLFGGNWPVCLKGVTLRHWVESLRSVVSSRSEQDRRKLFRDNAVRVYRIG